jgi:hypothetical protein
MNILNIDVDWMPKGFKAIRIGRPEYGELFIFNGNIYQYNELPFKDLMTGHILEECPPLPLIIVSKEIGVSYPTILAIYKGESKNPNYETIEKLSEYLERK